MSISSAEQVIFPSRLVPLTGFTSANYGNTMAIMDASTETAVYAGYVNAPGWTSGTKEINRIECVAQAKANGTGTTTVRVGIGDPDLAAGPPIRPDAIDQSGEIDIASITAGTPFTITLGTNRTISLGDYLCVQVDFSAFGTGPTLTMISIGGLGLTNLPQGSGIVTATQTFRGSGPAVVLLTTTDERIYFDPCLPPPKNATASGTDYNSSSTGTTIDGGDERGMLWIPQQAWDITRIEAVLRFAGITSDAEMVIYKDTTVLHTIAIDAALAGQVGTNGNWTFNIETPVRVNAGENIRITFKPTTTNNVRIYRERLFSAADRVLYGSEYDVAATNRVDGGAWNAPTSSTEYTPLFVIKGTPVSVASTPTWTIALI